VSIICGSDNEEGADCANDKDDETTTMAIDKAVRPNLYRPFFMIVRKLLYFDM
jgi:hypothetical protein